MFATLPVAVLRDLLNYDPDTGDLTWKVSVGTKIQPGRIAGHVAADTGYRRVRIDGANYRAHRIAWALTTGKWPEAIIDHVNGDRADNRWRNLRLATLSLNNANRKHGAKNKSGYVGVRIDKRYGTWIASIKMNGHRTHLGSFHSAEAAHEAYKSAAISMFGEFAHFLPSPERIS